MKKRKMEEVERTYCDICGRDVTHGTSYGFVMPNGDKWDVCAGYGNTEIRFACRMAEVQKIKNPLSCKQIVEMKIATESGDRYLS